MNSTDDCGIHPTLLAMAGLWLMGGVVVLGLNAYIATSAPHA